MVPATRILAALAFTVAAPVVVLGWLWLVGRLEAVVPHRLQRRLVPWLWLAPALVPVGVFLAWPLANTVWLSLRDAGSRSWAGLDNYRYLVTSGEVHTALRNNLLWLVLLTGGCLVVGLAVAVLTDRVRYESLAKAAVVLPTAIPFVAGAVIWRFMYQYRPPGLAQTGTLNAVLTAVGAAPVAWLVDGRTNNAALIGVGVWMTAGFATVILSAALKAVPPELHEAARIDGAGPWQAFRHVILPELRPAIVVTATLVAVSAFKAFDIVYAMTNGNYRTDVIANLMYRQLFVDQDYGRASAIAVLLTLLAAPILLVNARATRRSAP
ncbi:carbohydrate ABC transporter permease [Phytohabitans kaempferiae]|uniref:Carbohydrate ABC transporter permease n=1 Tax=Phytohabitans kaempferiae TaxID=1620943 RepID=A0ABV6M4P8_9ACTN